MSETNNKPVALEELRRLRNTMVQNKRIDGYMDRVGDKLVFFDSDPKIDGVGACPVSIDDVDMWIETYEENDSEAGRREEGQS